MSTKIIAIVAINEDGIIGCNNSIPWNVSEDLKHFKQLTTNNVVIMGRNTWESLGKKCLPNRINYVISKTGTFNLIENTHACVFTDIFYAIESAQLKYPTKDIFIIGGGSIYKQTLNIWDELYLTIINKEEVIKIEGDIVKLDEYPASINNLFSEVNSYATKCATYKKYQRKVIIKVNKKRVLYS